MTIETEEDLKFLKNLDKLVSDSKAVFKNLEAPLAGVELALDFAKISSTDPVSSKFPHGTQILKVNGKDVSTADIVEKMKKLRVNEEVLTTASIAKRMQSLRVGQRIKVSSPVTPSNVVFKMNKLKKGDRVRIASLVSKARVELRGKHASPKLIEGEWHVVKRRNLMQDPRTKQVAYQLEKDGFEGSYKSPVKVYFDSAEKAWFIEDFIVPPTHVSLKATAKIVRSFSSRGDSFRNSPSASASPSSTHFSTNGAGGARRGVPGFSPLSRSTNSGAPANHESQHAAQLLHQKPYKLEVKDLIHRPQSAFETSTSEAGGGPVTASGKKEQYDLQGNRLDQDTREKRKTLQMTTTDGAVYQWTTTQFSDTPQNVWLTWELVNPTISTAGTHAGSAAGGGASAAGGGTKTLEDSSDDDEDESKEPQQHDSQPKAHDSHPQSFVLAIDRKLLFKSKGHDTLSTFVANTIVADGAGGTHNLEGEWIVPLILTSVTPGAELAEPGRIRVTGADDRSVVQFGRIQDDGSLKYEALRDYERQDDGSIQYLQEVRLSFKETAGANMVSFRYGGKEYSRYMNNDGTVWSARKGTLYSSSMKQDQARWRVQDFLSTEGLVYEVDWYAWPHIAGIVVFIYIDGIVGVNVC